MKKPVCILDPQDIVIGQLSFDLAPPPPWYIFAQSTLGTKEVPGTKNSPIIMGWATSLGAKILGIAYTADSIPWCGLHTAKCMVEAGIKPPSIPVRAKAWGDWGVSVSPAAMMLGTILVFDRGNAGGHVGQYAGESEDAYLVLGGNQSDSVNYTWIAKSRCIARRWPKDVAFRGNPIYLTREDGIKLSENEA